MAPQTGHSSENRIFEVTGYKIPLFFLVHESPGSVFRTIYAKIATDPP